MSDSETAKLQTEIEELLLQVVESKQIKNYEILFDGNVLRGDGFLGEFFLGAIKDKDTGELVHVAIKKAFKNQERRAELSVDVAYYNEINFYSTIYPTLEQFQNQQQLTHPFHNVARFYLGKLDPPNEALVMENLKTKGFVIKSKQDLLDEQHTKFIFETYGRFHALSFALKDQNFQLYRKLADNTKDFMQLLCRTDNFAKVLNSMSKQAFESLHPKEDAEIIQHCEKYFDNASEELNRFLQYDGDYGTINHGDCWSNNMMFKYSESGQLEDMKLIDFQLVKIGTPVYDLSYFFYTGGCKELFDKLDDYLQIYHNSLSRNLRELGSDPDKLYPFQQLKNDWRKYAGFGVLMSLLLVKVKLMDKKDVDAIVDDSTFNGNQEFVDAIVDEELFRKRCREIILSGYKVGAL